MSRPIHRRTTVLTVDTGPARREPTRFYTLVVGRRGAGEVREDLLVPDGEELRSTRRHEIADEAA